jgi:hypothetical protein
MTETFYKKVGRRYVPVREYDSDLLNSFPHGCHLVVVRGNATSYRYSIEPDFAPMIAAGICANDAITEAVVKASETRPPRKPITEEQLAAWQQLVDLCGDDFRVLSNPSAQDISAAGVDAMVQAAVGLMHNDAVRQAYEQFLVMAKLTQQTHLD